MSLATALTRHKAHGTRRKGTEKGAGGVTHITHRSMVHVPSKLRFVLPPYYLFINEQANNKGKGKRKKKDSSTNEKKTKKEKGTKQTRRALRTPRRRDETHTQRNGAGDGSM